MKAWHIFVHSLRMIFSNFSQVLRICLAPLCVGVAALVGYALLLGVSPELMLAGHPDASGFSAVQVASFFLFWIILIVIGLWVVVAWHRFILLEEYPGGWVPAFRPDRILSYLGNLLLLGLLIFLMILPVALMAGVAGSGFEAVAVILMVALVLALNVVFFRLSPILPAAAINKPLRLKEAWAATRGADLTILLLLIIIIGFQILLQLALSLLMFIPAIGALFLIFGSALSALLNVSILTTLYGHYVERRDL